MSSSVSGSQGEQQRAGQQRGDDREARVLRGRGDQGDQPVLHRRQQHVLLGLGEPVHLVDEQHGLPTGPQVAPRLVQHRPDVLDPGGDRGDLDELRVGLPGHHRRRWSSCPTPGGPTGTPTSARRWPAGAAASRGPAGAAGRRSRPACAAASGPAAAARCSLTVPGPVRVGQTAAGGGGRGGRGRADQAAEQVLTHGEASLRRPFSSVAACRRWWDSCRRLPRSRRRILGTSGRDTNGLGTARRSGSRTHPSHPIDPRCRWRVGWCRSTGRRRRVTCAYGEAAPQVHHRSPG